MKSPLTVAILAGRKKDKPADSEEEMSGDEEAGGSADAEAKAAAMEDLFDAMKRRDTDAGVAALESFFEACGYGE